MFGQNFEILVAGNHLKDLLYGGIEKTARQAAGAQAPYLVEAVTEDMPWHYLRMRKGLPLGEKSFNGIRRQFYYLLAKEKRIV